MATTASIVPAIVLLAIAGGPAGCTRQHVAAPAAPEIAVLGDRPVRSGHHLWWVAGDSVYRGVAGTHPLHARRLYSRPGATLGPIAVTDSDQAFVVDGQRIDRIPPLPGAVASRTAVLTHPVRGDLRTDGTSLFWADDLGIRGVASAGGAVRTLVAEAGVRDIDVRDGRVFFAVGRTVKSMPAGGGPVRTEVSTDNNVTSICAGSDLYWIELGVEVHSHAGLRWLAPPGPAGASRGPRERSGDDAPGLTWDGRGPYRLTRDGGRCNIGAAERS